VEATVMALLVLYGIDVGIKYNSLCALSKLVEEIAGLPANRPFVGDMTYNTEIGIGASTFRKLQREPAPIPAMQYPVVPEFVGNKPQKIVLGKKSGIDNIEIWAEKLGIELTHEEAREMVDYVKNKGIELRRLLNEDEFREIVERIKTRKA
jgi:isopropylmalate/homocitrate/citramalate synthase